MFATATAEVAQCGREGKGHEAGCAELGQHEHSWAISAPVRLQQTRGMGSIMLSVWTETPQEEPCSRGSNQKYAQDRILRDLLFHQECVAVEDVLDETLELEREAASRYRLPWQQ